MTHGPSSAAASLVAPPREASHLVGLQALRAVAAMMVVVKHASQVTSGASPWLDLGEAGVDIFFVISGFVMAWTTRLGAPPAAAAARADERWRETRAFVGKRLLRIVPLYWLASLWTARRELAQGHFGTPLLKDFFFVPHASVAEAHRIFPLLTPGWTLNYEMFFYALVALSLLAPLRRPWLLLGVLAVLAATGSALPGADFTVPDEPFAWQGAADDSAALLLHFYTSNILLEFGFGVMLAGWMRRHAAPAWPRWIFFLLALAGFAGLAAGHAFWPRGLCQGLPAALIVWSATLALRGWRLPRTELLGAASYAIYLFHWASFGLTKPLAARLGETDGHPARIAALIGADVLVAVVAGVVVHVLVERPFMRAVKTRLSAKRA